MLPIATVLMPGLAGRAAFAPALEHVKLAALDQCASRIAETLPALAGFEAQLIQLFGGRLPHANAAPMGALLARYGGGADAQRRYLVASPVHLYADGGRLLMYGQDGLELDHDQADAYVSEVRTLFEARGMQLSAVTADHWCVSYDAKDEVDFQALSALIGRDIHDFMPAGAAAACWRALLNETQMQLHQSATNRQRTALGLKPVNSLWFWGEGEAPSIAKAVWSRVGYDNSLSEVLASLAGVEHRYRLTQDVPLIDPAVGGLQLIVVQSLAEASARDDVQRWAQLLQGVHDTVVVPLLEALMRGQIGAILLYPGSATAYRITRRRRWWAKRRGFKDMLGKL